MVDQIKQKIVSNRSLQMTTLNAQYFDTTFALAPPLISYIGTPLRKANTNWCKIHTNDTKTTVTHPKTNHWITPTIPRQVSINHHHHELLHHGQAHKHHEIFKLICTYHHCLQTVHSLCIWHLVTHNLEKISRCLLQPLHCQLILGSTASIQSLRSPQIKGPGISKTRFRFDTM